ncbi:hypothetical protein CWC46_04455 [Prodigiosinella confusarubida]|uniref:Uncharacterized protein n=1 Tax=Serratia sp. (strain ATCC 39006) TaxID=104623 RepID=A0A2I5TFV9_SERS3|nr:hypothetical protein CWC46_04455 [Serratia sp. ATCC 39006]AUH03446.1 hypothetical protein Ser39006_004455 [Serratia sp. ATCC 39006]
MGEAVIPEQVGERWGMVFCSRAGELWKNHPHKKDERQPLPKKGLARCDGFRRMVIGIFSVLLK